MHRTGAVKSPGSVVLFACGSGKREQQKKLHSLLLRGITRKQSSPCVDKKRFLEETDRHLSEAIKMGRVREKMTGFLTKGYIHLKR